MSITWNGVSSDTIGVIVERIPNRYVPTRRFSPQQVAGRNGNILLVDKSFPNVEQEYEVYLSAEAQGLPSVARACAEWLMGPDGYCRLEDSYDTTVYREAFLMGGYDLENILNKFGRCTITFSCKPQKYLLTGDTPIEIPAGITTYTGDVVQFDGVTGASITSLSTTITPIQDLHGYSSPWPAGGGKNLLNPNIFAGLTDTYDINSDGTITAKLADGNAWSVVQTVELKAGTYTLSYIANSGNARLRTSENDYATETTVTTTRTFTLTNDGGVKIKAGVGATAYPVVIKLQIEAGSTATTWSPYSNICPITGRTGLSVYRTGKNLFEVNSAIAGTTNGCTISVASDGTITVSGTPSAKVSKAIHPSAFSGIGNLVMSMSGVPSGIRIYCKKVGDSTSYPTLSNGSILETDTYAYNTFVFEVSTTYNGTATDIRVQVEKGSTATAYESYQGNTYAIDWTTEAGTVYGGTLDVVTGVLTVDRACVSLSTSWYWYISGTQPTGKTVVATTDFPEHNGTAAICSHYKHSNTMYIVNLQLGEFIVSDGGKGAYFCFKNESGGTAQEFKDIITAQETAGTPIQVCYELATPLTYQLTAQEVETLVGENNVWSSSGPVSVTVVTPLGGIVTNPTPFEARPMLTVSGIGEITINGKTIQILESVSDFDIDCETMEAEDNSKIYCMDFPELSGGENEIVGDGSITALTVTPRWWTL